jgi:predicted RecA/RadA family phage recombinase
MASNIKYKPGWQLSVVCSHPTTPTSGDPVRYGEMTGIALTDEGDGGNESTKTTVDFGPFIAELSVKGINGSGNSAVAVGDKLYYTDADTPVLNKKDTGRFFGYALEAIDAGATATIQVLHSAM